MGQNFYQDLLGKMGVGRRGELAQGVGAPILRTGNTGNGEELKEREQGVYLVQIFFHGGVFGLITAEDLISNELGVTISLEPFSAEPMCNLKAGDKGLVLGLIVGGRKVETKGVSDFHTRRVNDEEAGTGAFGASSTVHKECP